MDRWERIAKDIMRLMRIDTLDELYMSAVEIHFAGGLGEVMKVYREAIRAE